MPKDLTKMLYTSSKAFSFNSSISLVILFCSLKINFILATYAFNLQFISLNILEVDSLWKVSGIADLVQIPYFLIKSLNHS